jgi:FtsP/CotA-like multicopper oxidase with cupredoxin domain
MLHDQYKARDEVDVLTIQVGRAPLFLRGNKPVGAFDAGTSLRETSNLLHDLGTLAPNVVWKGENRINLQGGMNETGTWFKIDGVQGKFDTGTLSEKKLPAPPGSAREAEAGDAIEFEIHNDTEMNHPFHLHGFIFQPLYFLKMHHMGMMDGHRELHGEAQPYMIRYNYGPTEFVDTIDIPPHTSLVARVVLEDYPGSRGRWLFHCHIAQHAELGMISEIHVTA